MNDPCATRWMQTPVRPAALRGTAMHRIRQRHLSHKLSVPISEKLLRSAKEHSTVRYHEDYVSNSAERNKHALSTEPYRVKKTTKKVRGNKTARLRCKNVDHQKSCVGFLNCKSTASAPRSLNKTLNVVGSCALAQTSRNFEQKRC